MGMIGHKQERNNQTTIKYLFVIIVRHFGNGQVRSMRQKSSELAWSVFINGYLIIIIHPITFVQMQIKENIKAPRHWPLWGEFTGDRSPVNSPHKWPVTRKMFPFDDVIMEHNHNSSPPRSRPIDHIHLECDVLHGMRDQLYNAAPSRTRWWIASTMAGTKFLNTITAKLSGQDTSTKYE